MCGFAGILDPFSHCQSWNLDQVVLQMTRPLQHRGPDDLSSWSDLQGGYGVGFQRLAVLDLTEAGNQPMISSSGRYVIAFNGEIYNFREIQNRLRTMSAVYRSDGPVASDTEVIVTALESWGVERSLRELSGMFAMAIWDREEQRLVLSRDRLGEKPIYYGWLSSGVFGFASELKGLKAFPGFNAELDHDAINMFFKRGFVPTPKSIYSGINKLIPGTFLSITERDVQRGEIPSPEPYWSLDEVVTAQIARRNNTPESVRIEELDSILRQVIERQMSSDVPVGAFLSGGIDSSLIVSMMQRVSDKQVSTFSIGFEDESFNEAPFAAEVAKHLGTNHTEQYVTDFEAQNVIPLLPSIYDEPFADSSQIPTFLVSKLAKSKVTVCLTGDGGDELFGGYNSYLILSAIWKQVTLLPSPARKTLSALLHLVQILPSQDLLFRALAKTPRLRAAMSDPSRFFRLSNELVGDGDLLDAYSAFVTSQVSPLRSELYVPETPSQILGISAKLRNSVSDVEALMYWDTVGALVDDMLVKVDRASMSVGLETRAPLLDPEILEFSWLLGPEMKFRDGQGKVILRSLLDRYVPSNLFDRPKRGFGIPLRSWLTGPLNEWAGDVLSESNVASSGYLDEKRVTKMWENYQRSGGITNTEIWSALIFQSWLDSDK